MCQHMQAYGPSPELGLWVRKQRVAKEQGTLSEERLRILLELGFEFGEEANVTEEWELRFDLLVELLFMRVRPCHYVLKQSMRAAVGIGKGLQSNNQHGSVEHKKVLQAVVAIHNLHTTCRQYLQQCMSQKQQPYRSG